MTRSQIKPRYIIDLPETYRNLPTGEKRFFLIICLASFVLTLGWILFSPNGVMNYYAIQKKLQYVEAENKRLSTENQQLRIQIEKLQEDPEYLEKIARKDFGLLKKNEMVFDFD